MKTGRHAVQPPKTGSEEVRGVQLEWLSRILQGRQPVTHHTVVAAQSRQRGIGGCTSNFIIFFLKPLRISQHHPAGMSATWRPVSPVAGTAPGQLRMLRILNESMNGK